MKYATSPIKYSSMYEDNWVTPKYNTIISVLPWHQLRHPFSRTSTSIQSCRREGMIFTIPRWMMMHDAQSFKAPLELKIWSSSLQPLAHPFVYHIVADQTYSHKKFNTVYQESHAWSTGQDKNWLARTSYPPSMSSRNYWTTSVCLPWMQPLMLRNFVERTSITMPVLPRQTTTLLQQLSSATSLLKLRWNMRNSPTISNERTMGGPNGDITRTHRMHKTQVVLTTAMQTVPSRQVETREMRTTTETPDTTATINRETGYAGKAGRTASRRSTSTSSTKLEEDRSPEIHPEHCERRLSNPTLQRGKAEQTVAILLGSEKQGAYRQGSKKPVREKGDQKDRHRSYRQLLFAAIHCTEEERETSTSFKPQGTEPTSTKNTVQNGNIPEDVHNNKEKGLSYLSRSLGCLLTRTSTPHFPKATTLRVERSTLSILGTTLRASTITAGVHQGAESSPKTPTQEEDPNLCISRRSDHCSEEQGRKSETHKNSDRNPFNFRLQDQQGQIQPHPIAIDRTSGFPNKNQVHDSKPSWDKDSRLETRGPKTTDSLKSITPSDRRLYWQSNSSYSSSTASTTLHTSPDKTSQQPRPSTMGSTTDISERRDHYRDKMVGRPLKKVGRKELLERDSRRRDILRCIGLGLGHCIPRENLERQLEHDGQAETHKLEGIDDGMDPRQTKEMAGPHNSLTLRQQDSGSILEQIWWDSITRIEQTRRKDMASLPDNRDMLNGEIRTNDGEPSRPTIESPTIGNRMDNKRRCFQQDPDGMGTSHDGPFCDSSLHKTKRLRELSEGRRRDQNPLETLQQSVCLPPMAPGSKDYPEMYTRTKKDDDNIAVVGGSNMVPGSEDDTSRTTRIELHRRDTGDGDRDTPTKKHEMVAMRMSRKRQSLEKIGLTDAAINVILHPDAQAARNRSYSSIQGRFEKWCNARQIHTNRATATEVINFLAEGVQSAKWTTGTVYNYKSAILEMIEERELVANDKSLTEFLDSTARLSINSLDRHVPDLSPIVNYFLSQPNNLELALIDHTRKLCWLLAITGFLRPADLERIDTDKSSITNGELKLIIIAPKERRKNSPIEKVVIINSHPNKSICPVQCYEDYKGRFARTDGTRQHPTRQSIWYRGLIRSVKNIDKFITAERISNHIKFIMKMISANNDVSAMSARSVGADAAAQAGVDWEDIITQGMWSSVRIFDEHYRRSRRSRTNITTAILDDNSEISTNQHHEV